MSQTPKFPEPVRIKNRVYFARHALERYKKQLLAQALGVAKSDKEDEEHEPAIIELVAAPQAAREFGFTRRTLGRRFANVKLAEADAA